MESREVKREEYSLLRRQEGERKCLKNVTRYIGRQNEMKEG